MNQRVIESLRSVDVFEGLTDEEIVLISTICQAVRVAPGRTIFKEGDTGDELYIILDGSVRVMINTRRPDGTVAPTTINMLYSGQCFGEMTLLDNATRSATIIAADPTTLIMIHQPEFRALCEDNPRIGYRVIRNLADDLAYKLRSSNLLLRGNIRWQRGELERK